MTLQVCRSYMNSPQKTGFLIQVFMCGSMVMISIPSNNLTAVNSGGNHLLMRNYFFQFGLKHLVRMNVSPYIWELNIGNSWGFQDAFQHLVLSQPKICKRFRSLKYFEYSSVALNHWFPEVLAFLDVFESLTCWFFFFLLPSETRRTLCFLLQSQNVQREPGDGLEADWFETGLPAHGDSQRLLGNNRS